MEKYPLQWPVGYPRTASPERSRFGSMTFDRARHKLQNELGLMLTYHDAKLIVISTNLPLRNDGNPYASFKNVQDKGVAVYFKKDGVDMVLCCDRWDSIDHNIWAICKTVEAIRGIERWGVSDFLKRSFQGFNALPPKTEIKPWWKVLLYESKPVQVEQAKDRYRLLAKKYHPDAELGDTAKFQELNNAWEDAKKHFGI